MILNLFSNKFKKTICSAVCGSGYGKALETLGMWGSGDGCREACSRRFKNSPSVRRP